MTTEHIRVIVFQEEEGAWVAHCVDYDIATQAPDLPTLRRRLELTMQAELQQSMERHGKPFAGIGPAPLIFGTDGFMIRMPLGRTAQPRRTVNRRVCVVWSIIYRRGDERKCRYPTMIYSCPALEPIDKEVVD